MFVPQDKIQGRDGVPALTFHSYEENMFALPFAPSHPRLAVNTDPLQLVWTCISAVASFYWRRRGSRPGTLTTRLRNGQWKEAILILIKKINFWSRINVSQPHHYYLPYIFGIWSLCCSVDTETARCIVSRCHCCPVLWTHFGSLLLLHCCLALLLFIRRRWSSE